MTRAMSGISAFEEFGRRDRPAGPLGEGGGPVGDGPPRRPGPAWPPPRRRRGGRRSSPSSPWLGSRWRWAWARSSPPGRQSAGRDRVERRDRSAGRSRPRTVGEGTAAELAGGGAGRSSTTEIGLGALVGRQAVGRHGGAVSSSVDGSDDGGADALAPLVVGEAEDGHLDDAGRLGQDRLDLGRVDVDAAGDDEIVAAAVEEEIAVGVEATEVADGERVAAPGPVGGRGVAPVAEAGEARGSGTRRRRRRRPRRRRPGRARPTVPGRSSHSSGEQAVNWPSVDP